MMIVLLFDTMWHIFGSISQCVTVSRNDGAVFLGVLYGIQPNLCFA